MGKRRKTEQEDAEEGQHGEENGFRFSVGQRVLCNISKRSSGFLWKVGTIIKVAYRPSQEEVQKNKVSYEDEEGAGIIPYVVELDDGKTVATPEDDDECVRLAARCCEDTRIMRQLAFSEDTKKGTYLRFSEGDRVAVQLDVGIWEEGGIIETWARPERNGKPFKTWAGFAVPYAVQLDLGQIVFVPCDTPEVIRTEAADRPPQKSIAEQIGGTDRTPARKESEISKRFVVCQNATGEWVRRDLRTTIERPCAPPDDV